MQIRASSLAAFKGCPYAYWLRYEEHIEPETETAARRIGTNWHKLLEIATTKGSLAADAILADMFADPNTALDATILHGTLHAYPILFAEDSKHWEVLTVEREFKLPLLCGGEEVIVKGTIDRLWRNTTSRLVYIVEHKSTSAQIDSSSDYWKRIWLSPQHKIYLIAARSLQRAGEFVKLGIKPDDAPIYGVMYDVWKKPQIRPKALTIAETKELLSGFKTDDKEFEGSYLGVSFMLNHTKEAGWVCDGFPLQVVEKKGGNSAIENIVLYTARLFKEYSAAPQDYFVRKEIPIDARELSKTVHDMKNIVLNIQFMQKTNSWFCNERNCEALYKCPYRPICYNTIDVTKSIPNGFVKGTAHETTPAFETASE